MNLLILLSVLAIDPPTGSVKLLAGEDAYKKESAAEILVDGIVERTPTTGRPTGAARFNVFRLRFQDTAGKEDVRELHVPEKAFLLGGHVGKKVRLAGKPIDTKVEGGTLREFMPAWIQPLTGPLALQPGPDGVFARCDWQPEEARRRGTFQYVIRTPEQAASAMKVSGSTAGATAGALLARRFNLPAIDWEKQMILCVSAGLQGPNVEGLIVTSIKEEAGVLRVRWKLVEGKGAGLGFGCPAQSVLVPRTTSEVKFEREETPKKR